MSGAVPIEYEGRVYDSMADLCRKNKICDKTVYYYMNKYKYTREEALAIATRVKYKDVYGRTYKTIREMAESLGVSRGWIEYRLKKGLPIG